MKQPKQLTTVQAIRGRTLRIVSHEIDSLVRRHGFVTTRQVIDHARPKQSPLHRFFTWDDRVAAEKYREFEARTLIQMITVHRQQNDKSGDPIRRFVSILDEKAFGGYAFLDIADVVGSQKYLKQALTSALAGLKGWQARFAGLKEFTAVYLEIDSIERNLKARGKVRNARRIRRKHAA